MRSEYQYHLSAEATRLRSDIEVLTTQRELCYSLDPKDIETLQALGQMLPRAIGRDAEWIINEVENRLTERIRELAVIERAINALEAQQ